MHSSPYLTATELAAMLRISVRTLYTYIDERRVPTPLWLGGKRLWTPQVVHDFIASARQRKRH
jgi:predicted DNA-binding transcriptional regulator AlpA